MFSGDIINFISKEKPDLILVLANSPAREFRDDSLLIRDNWQAILKTTSILSGGYTLFANRVGFEDGLGFWGGSCIIDEDTKVLAKLPKYDEVIKTIEVKI